MAIRAPDGANKSRAKHKTQIFTMSIEKGKAGKNKSHCTDGIKKIGQSFNTLSKNGLRKVI